MSTILTLTKTSMKMFLRNKQAIFFTLLMPLFIMVLLGFIGFDKVPQSDVGLVVAANAQPQTQEFVKHISEFPTFKIHEGTLEAERQALKDGDRAVVLSVPADFIESAARQTSTLQVLINEAQQAQARGVISVLDQYLDKTSLARANVPQFFELQTETVNARNLKYIDFLLPGLIAMSVMQMSVFSVAFVFVQYKEKGVLKRLLATPLKPLHFVIANAATRLVVSVVQALIFIAVGIFILKATVVGSYLLVFLCVVLGALMFLGLGFTISGIAKTVESVPALANLVVFPMLFLGGVFFPTTNMPNWLQTISKFLPLTPFSHSLREIMNNGTGLGGIARDLMYMAVWGTLLIGLSTYFFSFQERDSA